MDTTDYNVVHIKFKNSRVTNVNNFTIFKQYYGMHKYIWAYK